MHRRLATAVGISVWLCGTTPIAPQSAAIQDSDPARSAISGVVTDGTTHTPLRGVTVALSGASMATVTDSKGRFVFRYLKGGSYGLTVEKAGYARVRPH